MKVYFTVSKRGIFENFSLQRGTPRESDTASRREDAQLVTSQLVKVDTTVTFISFTDVLSSSRITRKWFAPSVAHSALEHVLNRFPLLHHQRVLRFRFHLGWYVKHGVCES